MHGWGNEAKQLNNNKTMLDKNRWNQKKQHVILGIEAKHYQKILNEHVQHLLNINMFVKHIQTAHLKRTLLKQEQSKAWIKIKRTQKKTRKQMKPPSTMWKTCLKKNNWTETWKIIVWSRGWCVKEKERENHWSNLLWKICSHMFTCSRCFLIYILFEL